MSKPEISGNLVTGHSTPIPHPPYSIIARKPWHAGHRGDTVPKQHVKQKTFSLPVTSWAAPRPLSYTQDSECPCPKATVNSAPRANFAHISAGRSGAPRTMQVPLPRPPMRSLEASVGSQLPTTAKTGVSTNVLCSCAHLLPTLRPHSRSAPLAPTSREPILHRWKDETCTIRKKDKTERELHGLHLLT